MEIAAQKQRRRLMIPWRGILATTAVLGIAASLGMNGWTLYRNHQQDTALNQIKAAESAWRVHWQGLKGADGKPVTPPTLTSTVTYGPHATLYLCRVEGKACGLVHFSEPAYGAPFDDVWAPLPVQDAPTN